MRHGVRLHQKARSPALKAARPSRSCGWSFPLPPTARPRREGIPFDEYYARIKAEKSREIELLVNLKSPHIVHINEFDAVEEPDHSAFYLLIRMDLLQALTAFRVDHLTDTPEQVRLRPQGHAGYLRRPARLPRKRHLPPGYQARQHSVRRHRGLLPRGFRRVAVHRRAGRYAHVVGYRAICRARATDRSSRPRSDLYSLGLVLYEADQPLARTVLPAYPAKLTAEDRYNAQCKRLAGGALPPPDNCPPALAAVILKLCAPDPGDRYQSVQEVLDALSPLRRTCDDAKRSPAACG